MTFDRRILSKQLSSIENDYADSEEILTSILQHKSSAKILGFTGSPGAGKSTVIDSVIVSLLEQGLSVAVLAIDPSSPFSGGALLGDRARMHQASQDQNLYIRSSATRGKLGGLSPRTPEMIEFLSANGFDVVIVETVGVGQAELDIMKCTDLVCLVLSPHMGDSLQTAKAGIIEIADVYTLNKSDLVGIDQLEKDLLASLSTSSSKKETPIVRTCINDAPSYNKLSQTLLETYAELKKNGELSLRRRRNIRFQVELHLQEQFLTDTSENLLDTASAKKILTDVEKKKMLARTASKKLLELK